MRVFISSLGAALVGILLLNGCGKPHPTTAETPAAVINAVDFRPAFASASPDLKNTADQVMMNIQASLYGNALDGLAKLAAHPALTDVQKKVVADLTDQLKKKMAAAAGQPK